MAMNRKKKTIIISAVVVGLIAIVILSKAVQTKEGQPVQTAAVEKRALIESKVTASGEIRPVNFYNLTAEVPGRVEQIYVVEGDAVKKGQPLVRVDATQFSMQTAGQEAAVRVSQTDVANNQVAVQQAENNIHQANSNLSAAQAELERTRADFQYAENEYNRNLQLVENGVIPKSVFDQVRSRYVQAQAVIKSQQARVNQLTQQIKDVELGLERAKSALAAAEARVNQSRSQLDIQSDQLKKTTRYSPIDGVVSSLPVKVGEFALANFSSTPLLTVADMSQINAEIKVDETDIADVAISQKVKVKVDALGEVEIEGEVIEKGASAITRSGQTISSTSNTQEARDFLVKVKLNPTPEIRAKLKPGMSSTATITTARVESALAVPLQAIVPREEAQQGQESKDQPVASGIAHKKEVDGVFVYSKEGRAKFVKVTTGIKGDQEIEIKSGLNEKDEIITGQYKVLRGLKDGDLVKREPKTENSQSGSNQSK